ncbi:hypothetical protein UlMin_036752 [Ulmus minor]
MMEAGVHFGHGTRKWNPRMAPSISEKCKASDFIFDAASRGKQFLIVGTKNKVADLVVRVTIKARCHYVNKKWLVGMLTNWYTIKNGLLVWLPDIVIIIDQQEEYMALQECITLGIPTICLINTNCDPDLVDILISANDDAIVSIRLILNKLYLQFVSVVLAIYKILDL